MWYTYVVFLPEMFDVTLIMSEQLGTSTCGMMYKTTGLKIKVKGKGVERVILEYKAKELWILDHEFKKPLFS